MEEQVLIIIKPDAMIKGVAGAIMDMVSASIPELKMVGAKLIKVKREVVEKHYEEHKTKPFFSKLVDHLTGKYHTDQVLAFVYQGKDAIKKIRDLAGETHPEAASPLTVRGKFGRVHTKTDVFENAIHVSDSPESAEKEIKLWFSPDELIERIYPAKNIDSKKEIWA